ncbi:MAG TPA: carboxypeptidase regulatory-like domain-containing protein [Candidatus Acidoferrales bacterium]|nr:carboxypeptidase regulatory-like domain-containing protein [Candidatus Acidoferrales bacterium]
MRSFVVALAALGFLTGPLTAVAQTTSPKAAPADEYFGRTGESVLEIRNRLNVLDAAGDADIKSPDALGDLDNVEDAVLDWQHKYPADPWVAGAMARLLESYARAGAAQDPHATTVMQRLVANYPHAPKTAEALFALAGATVAEPQNVPGAIVTGSVVDATTGAPIAGAVVIVARDAFATTGSDGSFEVSGVPLQHAQAIVVEPPSGTPYAPYRGTVDASAGRTQAGTIELATR